MTTVPLQLSDLVYNAATQSFEALVTVHDPNGARRYACAIDAPITMEYEDAAAGLATQAVRRYAGGRRDKVHMPVATPARRTTRNVGLRRSVLQRTATRTGRAT